jgi:hypothetical protein
MTSATLGREPERIRMPSAVKTVRGAWLISGSGFALGVALTFQNWWRFPRIDDEVALSNAWRSLSGAEVFILIIAFVAILAVLLTALPVALSEQVHVRPIPAWVGIPVGVLLCGLLLFRILVPPTFQSWTGLTVDSDEIQAGPVVWFDLLAFAIMTAGLWLLWNVTPAKGEISFRSALSDWWAKAQKMAPLPAPEESGGRETPVKRCPDCAEVVLAEAKVCKHCGFRFEPPPT